MTQSRAKQNAGERFTGVDVINGSIADFEKLRIVEPVKVKEQIIASATKTANRILRIDNVIAISHSMSSEQPQGMPLVVECIKDNFKQTLLFYYSYRNF